MTVFRNQYLITNTSSSNDIKGYKSSKVFGFYLNVFPPLETNFCHHKETSVLQLGIVLDPYNPGHSNAEITANLAQRSPDLSSFLKQIETLSGRYLFLFKNKTNFIAVGDACHFRQIFYGLSEDNIVLTSSPKLFLEYFDLKLLNSPLKNEFTNSAAFNKSEQSWFGNQSPDDRLKKLLPNHYLDLTSGSANRYKPKFTYKNKTEEERIFEASQILKGSYKALIHRNYNLIQPLTAGWDSRVLLAATKPWKANISYYVFNRKKESEIIGQDVRIPLKLSKNIGLDFQAITPVRLRKSFIKQFNKNHIYPRVLPKTRNIQYHFDKHKNDNTININGNGAEILRCYYGNHLGKINLNMLIYLSGFPNSKFVRNELTSWYKPAKKYSEETGLDLLDLFYWEQRLGNWGALFPYEMDIAIEEISPFNNKSFLYLIYFSGYKNRKKPDHIIFKKLIHFLWAEVLNEEINPDSPKLKSLIKRNAYTRYFALLFHNVYKQITA